MNKKIYYQFYGVYGEQEGILKTNCNTELLEEEWNKAKCHHVTFEGFIYDMIIQFPEFTFERIFLEEIF